MNSAALVTYTRSAQDQASHIFSIEGVRLTGPPLLAEKLLTVDGCRGMEPLFFEARPHAHIGRTNWTQ